MPNAKKSVRKICLLQRKAANVTQQTNDKQQVEPTVEAIKENTGGDTPKKLGADAGYFSETGVEYLEGEEIDSYAATDRDKHGDPPEPSQRGRIPTDLTKKERMARKLRTKKDRETYSKRKAIVEPVFGQIKEVRGFADSRCEGQAMSYPSGT